MSIEINGPHGRPPAEVADSRATSTSNQNPATARPAQGDKASTDTLSLTSEAAQLRALEDEIAALPVVDTERVQEIQRSLATGSFQIDPARVADKLLRFESSLAGDS